jgi:epoxide hydrolase
MTDLRPFRIDIPEADLADLRARLDRTRWADDLPEAGWDYGVPAAHVRKLAGYWRDGFDWRRQEARLNAYPQFTTALDGQHVHFLHVRSPEPGALPLILTHGWPGSVAEFLDVIGPLTDPRAHGAGPADIAFHLVIPSLPGFGFSGPTTERGWTPKRIGAAWAELMARLGYDRYGAAGNDWGSYVAPEVGRAAPDHVTGVHVTQLFSLPAGQPGELDDLSAEEQEALDGLRWEEENLVHDKVQMVQPQTLAHALTDSPAGLLGWHCQLYGALDPDYILTNVSIHWLTGTVASAMRLYWEFHHDKDQPGPTTVPLGLAQFSHDFKAIRRFARRDHSNIVSWNVYDAPGHFAAHQSPDLLVADIRQFFSRLRDRLPRAQAPGEEELPGAGSGLREDGLEVVAGGVFGHHQALGDLASVEALAQQPEDLGFAGGQSAGPGVHVQTVRRGARLDRHCDVLAQSRRLDRDPAAAAEVYPGPWRADRHAVLVRDKGRGDVVRRGRDRRHGLIRRVQAQQRIGRRFGLASHLQIGVEYEDRGPDRMQLPSRVDECAGDGRAESGRHRAGKRGEQAQFARQERSAVVAPQVEHAPAAVPVGKYDDGGVADAELALRVTPDQRPVGMPVRLAHQRGRRDSRVQHAVPAAVRSEVPGANQRGQSRPGKAGHVGQRGSGHPRHRVSEREVVPAERDGPAHQRHELLAERLG